MEFLDDLSVASIDLNFDDHLNDSNEFFERRHSNHEVNSHQLTQGPIQHLNNENNQNQVNCVDVCVRRADVRRSKPLTLLQRVMANNHASSAIIQNNDVQHEVEQSASVVVVSEPTIANIPEVIPAANNLQYNDVQSAGPSARDEIELQLTTEDIREVATTAGVQNTDVGNEAGASHNAQQTNVSRPKPKAKAATKASSNRNTMPCRQYDYFEQYRRRQEYRMKKLEWEEQEKRKCIAKPMPKFNAIHMKAASKQPMQSVISSPKTPDVLKRSVQMMNKHKQKMEELERKQTERPPIVARSCDVLQSEPFKPKLKPKYTTIEPFDLKMSDRLAERKHYDDERERNRMLLKEIEDKKKQEKDEHVRKMIREQTVFKARANPFK